MSRIPNRIITYNGYNPEDKGKIDMIKKGGKKIKLSDKMSFEDVMKLFKDKRKN